MVYAIAYKLKIQKESEQFSKLFIYVIIFQVYIIIGGIVTGLFSVFQLEMISPFIKFISLGLIILSFFSLQSKYMFEKFTLIISKIVKSKFSVPCFKRKQIFILLCLSTFFWLIWGMGIYFFIDSTGIQIINPIHVIFLFPFSVSVGIVAVFSPGGFGIREGVFAGLLIALGSSISSAAEISILSRIWFILGEIIFFLISTIFPYLYTLYIKRHK